MARSIETPTPTPPAGLPEPTPEQIRELTHGPAAAIEGAGASKWPRERAEAFLRSCPRVPVFVPLEFHEQSRPGTYYQSVVWNGWEVRVRKGAHDMVPQPIAEIIWQMLATERTRQYIERTPWNCLIVPGSEQTVRGESFGGHRLEM